MSIAAKQSIRDQLVCPMSTKELATLILGMVEQVNSIDLYAYQRVLAFRVIESLLLNDGAVITALFSRQSGKSAVLSSVALALCIFLPGLAKIYPNDDRLSMFKDGVWIGVFAPKLELSGPIYIKIRNVAESDNVREIMADPELDVSIVQSRGDSLAFSNGSIVKAQTASEQTINEGGTYHLVLIDEAQRVSKFKISKEIGPMLAACVTGEAIVVQQDGSLVSMRDVQTCRRRLVTSVNGHGEVVDGQISEFIDSGVQDTGRVVLKSGRSITATWHHPLLVYDRKTRALVWRKLEELDIGDHVCLPKSVPIFGTTSVNGEHEAYLLGAMVGDGSYRDDGLPRLSNCDDDIWQAAEYVAAAHGFNVKYYLRRQQTDGRIYREATFSANKGKQGNWLTNALRELGLWGQTGEKKRLERAATLVKAELAEFIAGLFDTDGSVVEQDGRTGIIEIVQASRGLLDDLQHLLQRFGIHGTVKRTFYPARRLRGQILQPSTAWKLTVSGKENIERFAASIPLRVGYKAAKLALICEYLKYHKSKRVKDYPNLVWEKIVEIENSGPQQVWDVVVPEHQSYVANGIVNHNTNGSMVKIGTAWMSRGGFHNDIQHNVSVQERGGARNHYQFDYEQVIAEKRALYNRQKREFEAGKRPIKADVFHLRYEKYLQGELQRLAGNKDSEEFKMNFRLLWQESRMIAIKEATLTSCALVGSEMNQPKHAGYQVASLDVAKSVDSTVLTIMEVERTSVIIDKNSRVPSGQIAQPQIYQRKLILGWLELQGSFEGIQYNAIKAFLQDYSVRYMLVDATGIGDPVCERLQVLLTGIEVEPFKYNTSSKSDLYKYYLQELEAQRVLYPAGALTQRSKEYQKFIQQHTDLEKEWHGSYMVCHAPEGEHDDYPDSSAVCVWASRKIIEDNQMVEVEVEAYNREDSSRRHPGMRENSRESRYVRRRH